MRSGTMSTGYAVGVKMTLLLGSLAVGLLVLKSCRWVGLYQAQKPQ